MTKLDELPNVEEAPDSQTELASQMEQKLHVGEESHSPIQISRLALPKPKPEHPEGVEIRRQVEFYFSDENLVNDKFLLQLCHGSENLPVSVSRILGFKKMRRFKPRSAVVASLRKSTFLDISEDGKTITRKVPIEGVTVPIESPTEDTEYSQAGFPRRAKVQVNAISSKEKPSGFEEYATVGPITPAEYQEALECYDPELAFSERIQTAIQRYKAKHRFRYEIYAQIFNKWMKFGGVDYGQRQFTGNITQEVLDQYDAREIAQLMATHHVDADRDNKAKWAVDFEGVAKAFLSSQVPRLLDCRPVEVERTTQVLRTFYNYLLHNNVCPEYGKSILAARAVCDLADQELPKVKFISDKFPGAFNIACSTLFGGHFNILYTGDRSWDFDADGKVDLNEDSSLGDTESAMIFKTGIVAYGTEEHYEMIQGAGLNAITSAESGSGPIGLEVVAVEMAPPEIVELYAEQTKEYGDRMEFPTLGKMICRPWTVFNDYGTWDLPDDKPVPEAAAQGDQPQEYTFFVEDDILTHCFVGMKMEVITRKLSIGLHFIDAVTAVYCSFYEYLPNELAASNNIWKEVVWAKGRPERQHYFDVDEYIADTSGDNPKVRLVSNNIEDDEDDQDAY